ncbi:sugar transferase [Alkalimonas sp. MEB108]|uniref:Sugar transferase n=1 Tax=Alkalimonas cellulosilytica TaxID=3058395 RepID=A0ABU7J4P7_9GAMM|nr:sugar transferase [Alkalimonas sp. MEB108]MEE2001483.1 sugar transferase [Alkalimonas sp. MEB108]
MTLWQAVIKRSLDLLLALLGLLLLGWLLLLCWLIASIETRSNGMFAQQRIGRFGRPFRVYKIKTMFDASSERSSITAQCQQAITRSGRLFRRLKLDELPQLWNVLWGQMSFVGPRPDVPGYADCLKGEERLILQLRPGITGPASIKYCNEEALLAAASDAKAFNDGVIWPDKVRINLAYYHHYSVWRDLGYLLATLVPSFASRLERRSPPC